MADGRESAYSGDVIRLDILFFRQAERSVCLIWFFFSAKLQLGNKSEILVFFYDTSYICCMRGVVLFAL